MAGHAASTEHGRIHRDMLSDSVFPFAVHDNLFGIFRLWHLCLASRTSDSNQTTGSGRCGSHVLADAAALVRPFRIQAVGCIVLGGHSGFRGTTVVVHTKRTCSYPASRRNISVFRVPKIGSSVADFALYCFSAGKLAHSASDHGFCCGTGYAAGSVCPSVLSASFRRLGVDRRLRNQNAYSGTPTSHNSWLRCGRLDHELCRIPPDCVSTSRRLENGGESGAIYSLIANDSSATARWLNRNGKDSLGPKYR